MKKNIANLLEEGFSGNNDKETLEYVVFGEKHFIRAYDNR